MYTFLGKFAPLLLKLVGSTELINRDALPQDGGYVIACTHSGWAEVIWLAIAVLPREIHFMAKKELFKNRLSGWFLKSINAFPVNREAPGISSLKIPVTILKEGGVVGIFPSGTRNNSSQGLKRGAIHIAYTAGVPIIPAVYEGSATIKPIDIFKRKENKIIFGKPIIFNSSSIVPSEKKSYQQIKLSELESTLKDLEARLKNL